MVELRHSDEKPSRFVVGNLLPQPELNGVYRYFLHQNPEICVKNFMRSTQPIAVSGVSEAAVETLEDQVDLAVQVAAVSPGFVHGHVGWLPGFGGLGAQ
ncbi:hypothetical protein CCANI_04285 [Corynebacterium canis]|nr:hypothetical protein CCANI_04285 [Corynebacterium canis]